MEPRACCTKSSVASGSAHDGASLDFGSANWRQFELKRAAGSMPTARPGSKSIRIKNHQPRFSELIDSAVRPRIRNPCSAQRNLKFVLLAQHTTEPEGAGIRSSVCPGRAEPIIQCRSLAGGVSGSPRTACRGGSLSDLGLWQDNVWDETAWCVIRDTDSSLQKLPNSRALVPWG